MLVSMPPGQTHDKIFSSRSCLKHNISLDLQYTAYTVSLLLPSGSSSAYHRLILSFAEIAVASSFMQAWSFYETPNGPHSKSRALFGTVSSFCQESAKTLKGVG